MLIHSPREVFTALIGSTGQALSYPSGGTGDERLCFSQRHVFSILGDSKEPAREENRLRMHDGAARLKARRFHVEEWNRA